MSACVRAFCFVFSLIKTGVKEKKNTKQVEERVNSDEKTEQTGEAGKKKKENHLISSCCLTFLFGHLSHRHGRLPLLVLRDFETWSANKSAGSGSVSSHSVPSQWGD